MKFIDSIDNCVFNKYADFNGKASKSEDWWDFQLLPSWYHRIMLAT